MSRAARTGPVVTVRAGRGRLRITAGSRGHTVLTVGWEDPVPDVDLVRAAAVAAGPAPLRTSALPADRAAAFLAEGFVVVDELVLLQRTLDTEPGDPLAPEPPGLHRPGLHRAGLHRAGRHPWPALADVDREAFGPGGCFEAGELAAAASATSASRVRTVPAGRDFASRGLAAFAITGQAERDGFLQRLAVIPGAQRRGLARALVADAVRWCWRRGATQVWVNTAATNEAALALYEGLGFRRRPTPLLVLARAAPAGRAPA